VTKRKRHEVLARMPPKPMEAGKPQGVWNAGATIHEVAFKDGELSLECGEAAALDSIAKMLTDSGELRKWVSKVSATLYVQIDCSRGYGEVQRRSHELVRAVRDAIARKGMDALSDAWVSGPFKVSYEAAQRGNDSNQEHKSITGSVEREEDIRETLQRLIAARKQGDKEAENAAFDEVGDWLRQGSLPKSEVVANALIETTVPVSEQLRKERAENARLRAELASRPRYPGGPSANPVRTPENEARRDELVQLLGNVKDIETAKTQLRELKEVLAERGEKVVCPREGCGKDGYLHVKPAGRRDQATGQLSSIQFEVRHARWGQKREDHGYRNFPLSIEFRNIGEEGDKAS
jgi:hypothetical protein